MGRNKNLNKKMRDERKERILSAALKLFSANGLAGTKISDIAEESDMSQGLVYHYFGSKEDVFTELIETAFDRLISACLWLKVQQTPPDEKIKMAVEQILQNLSDNDDSARFHLLIAHATASDAIPAKAKEIINNKSSVPYRIMEDIIVQGQSEGTIRKYDPQDLSLLFWNTIKGLAIHKAAHGKRYRKPDPEILLHMFITTKE